MDAACWGALSAMGAAVAGVAAFAGKVYLDLKGARAELSESQNARVAAAEEHKRELVALRDMLGKKRGKGGQP